MKIFERDFKINFVDKNNVFVGFDNDQNCCEDFGWKITRKFPADRYKEIGEEKINLDGFKFDVTYFKKVMDSEDLGVREAVVFRLTNGNKEIFLTLWNHHNGYYSHGFEMKAGDELLFSGDL